MSHLGWETRQAEILADGHNLPLYWPQANAERKLCFKFIDADKYERQLEAPGMANQRFSSLEQDIPQIQEQSFVFTGGVPVA